MKELTRIKLINWHYFENVTIEIKGSTLITGDNGAGKSTILDAVQYVLVADLRRIKFNVSAFEETRRDLAGYLRCKTGSEGENGLRQLRQGDITSYVVLEFYDNVKRKHFLLGVVVDSYADGSTWDSKFFKVEDCRLEDSLFLTGRRPRNAREFKAGLREKGQKARIYATVEDYKTDLLVKLGSLSERFFNLLVKAISFKPIGFLNALPRPGSPVPAGPGISGPGRCSPGPPRKCAALSCAARKQRGRSQSAPAPR